MKESLTKPPGLEDSQMETTRLRSYLGLPKVSFSLRTCPPDNIKQATVTFDEALREAVSDQAGSPLSDWAWLKASLPMASACLLCTEQTAKRRPLHSAANHHVVPVLAAIVNQLFESIVAGSVLPPGSGLCHPCLRGVKFLKLREELNQQNERLRQQLKQAGEACGFQCERQGVIPTCSCASSGTGVAGTSTARDTTESPDGSTAPSQKRPASPPRKILLRRSEGLLRLEVPLQ